jgi:ribosomal protein S18 acetylase RimI-like enzyme
MATIRELQDYMRNAAARSHAVYPCAPFHLYLHETDDFRFFNYAIPDVPLEGVTPAQLDALRAAFAARGRTLRFEFLHEYAPRLGPALAALGVPVEGENPLLVCTPDAFRPIEAPAGLHFVRLAPESPDRDLVDHIETASRGFGDEWGTVLPERVAELRRRLASGEGGFLARSGEEPVAAGSYTVPIDGFTELVGIATLPAHRRRGIAAALTAVLAADAFARGVRTAFLTAADDNASRVYQRCGFYRIGTGLAYGE